MVKKSGKQKLKLGTIVAIPLPSRKFAFAKLFKGLNFGVYDFVSSKIEPVDDVTNHKIAFFQPAVDSAVKSGKWPIIGEEPFPDEDSAWGPPKAAGIFAGQKIDPLKIRITHKDMLRPATPKDIAGLDIDFLVEAPDDLVEIIVDRLIKGEHEKYQVPRR